MHELALIMIRKDASGQASIAEALGWLKQAAKLDTWRCHDGPWSAASV